MSIEYGIISVADYISLYTVRYLSIAEKEVDFLVNKYFRALRRYETNANTVEFLLA